MNRSFNSEHCQQARLSKDARFDGLFFTAVKTTGIYCRSICPAPAPKEKNVEYFESAIEAANAGYRPCLRCRPDSAPASYAWKGTDTTLERAIKLLQQQEFDSLTELAERLGISDRYLRKLFNDKLGVSPKQYHQYQQLMFAKKLLHETGLPITDVAFSAGFGSVRRFNEVFQQQLKLTPSQLRKKSEVEQATTIRLSMSYRPPYDIDRLFAFINKRLVDSLEWCEGRLYGRSFELNGTKGWFSAEFKTDSPEIILEIAIEDLSQLKNAVWQIRRVLDLDADMQLIERQLADTGLGEKVVTGVRLPGIWSCFEAGIRAILGQQVSVTAATNLVTKLVSELSAKQHLSGREVKLFPTPQMVAQSDLAFFRMPQSRKDTIKRLAEYFVENEDAEQPDNWLKLKGIGPWTVDYAKMRGLSDSDIWLEKDLGIIKAVKQFDLDAEKAAPWRSYLTFNLWNQL